MFLVCVWSFNLCQVVDVIPLVWKHLFVFVFYYLMLCSVSFFLLSENGVCFWVIFIWIYVFFFLPSKVAEARKVVKLDLINHTSVRRTQETVWDLLPPLPKVKFSRDFMIVKNIINVYSLIYYLFFYTIFNYPPPIKSNQFKYL